MAPSFPKSDSERKNGIKLSPDFLVFITFIAIPILFLTGLFIIRGDLLSGFIVSLTFLLVWFVGQHEVARHERDHGWRG